MRSTMGTRSQRNGLKFLVGLPVGAIFIAVEGAPRITGRLARVAFADGHKGLPSNARSKRYRRNC